jgi:hypothetical protein
VNTKKKLQRSKGKIQGPSRYLLKKEDKERKEREDAIRSAVNTGPPSYPYIENIPYINYNEGSLEFIQNKKKGKTKCD